MMYNLLLLLLLVVAGRICRDHADGAYRNRAGRMSKHGVFMKVETQLDSIAAKHGFSSATVRQIYESIRAGNGTMAQFAQPELGGSGQWMRGGMIMIGDMFNQTLKSRVDALCNELAALYFAAPAAAPPTSAGWGAAAAAWWPAEFGSPTASGGQNALEYAYFPQINRLAVRKGKKLAVYDTTGRQIGGFSQQQGGGQTLHFSSQRGMFPVSILPVVL